MPNHVRVLPVPDADRAELERRARSKGVPARVQRDPGSASAASCASTGGVGAISAWATSFRYHAEETARAHILKTHLGRMSASCFAALGTRFPPGLPMTGAEALAGSWSTREVTW